MFMFIAASVAPPIDILWERLHLPIISLWVIGRMARFPGIKRLFRASAVRADAEVDAELRFHLETKVAELEAAGMSRDEARRAALAQFGDWGRYRDQTLDVDRQMAREARVRELAASVLGDVRYALRGLRRTPVFTAAAVSCTALGIGVWSAGSRRCSRLARSRRFFMKCARPIR